VKTRNSSRAIASLGCASLLFFTATCSAEQWPTHPVPTQSSEVAAYREAIKLRPSLDTCMKQTEGTTPGMRDCLSSEHAYQDKRLNTVYKKLMGSLSQDKRTPLRDEERQWIAFRDKFCAMDSNPGQAQELDADECLVDQTADRATELEARLEQKQAR
jgi:uncharacterized protein YecT (DUF1311 family)